MLLSSCTAKIHVQVKCSLTLLVLNNCFILFPVLNMHIQAFAA